MVATSIHLYERKVFQKKFSIEEPLCAPISIAPKCIAWDTPKTTRAKITCRNYAGQNNARPKLRTPKTTQNYLVLVNIFKLKVNYHSLC